MPKIVTGKVNNTKRLSIGNSTVLAPFSDNNDTFSAKLVALTMAPPIEMSCKGKTHERVGYAHLFLVIA